MLELSLENLKAEVRRAEAERKEDHAKFRSFPPYDPDAPLPKHTHESTFFEGDTFLSFEKATDEERKDFFRTTYHYVEDEASVTERALALSNFVRRLAKNLKKEKSGLSLTVHSTWKDESTTHILVAHVGNIRTVLYNPDADTSEKKVTRLTCEHHLSRQHEQEHLAAQGFTIRQLKSGALDIFKENTLVAKQVGSELFPLVPWPNKSGSATTTRSLGNELSHQKTGIFSSTPSISYHCVPRNQRCYLVTCNTGITQCVSDEEIAYILGQTDSLSRSKRLQTIASLAIERGSKEKVSLSIIPLKNITISSIQCFVSAYRDSEMAEHISRSGEFTFNHVMRTRKKQMYKAAKKKLTPCELNYLLPTLRPVEDEKFYLHGHRAVQLIDAFIASEAQAKKTLNQFAQTRTYQALLAQDSNLSRAAKRYHSGKITAYELLSGIIDKSLHLSSITEKRSSPVFFRENYFHDFLIRKTNFTTALERFNEFVNNRVKTLAGRLEKLGIKSR